MSIKCLVFIDHLHKCDVIGTIFAPKDLSNGGSISTNHHICRCAELRSQLLGNEDRLGLVTEISNLNKLHVVGERHVGEITFGWLPSPLKVKQLSKPKPFPAARQFKRLRLLSNLRQGLVPLDLSFRNQPVFLSPDFLEQFTRRFITRVLRHQLALHGQRQDEFAQTGHATGGLGDQVEMPHKWRLQIHQVFGAGLLHRQHCAHALAPSDWARMLLSWSRRLCASACRRA